MTKNKPNGTVLIDPADIRSMNPRTSTALDLSEIEKSLMRAPLISQEVLMREQPDGVGIVSGHLRFRAAMDVGMPVRVRMMGSNETYTAEKNSVTGEVEFTPEKALQPSFKNKGTRP